MPDSWSMLSRTTVRPTELSWGATTAEPTRCPVPGSMTSTLNSPAPSGTTAESMVHSSSRRGEPDSTSTGLAKTSSMKIWGTARRLTSRYMPPGSK